MIMDVKIIIIFVSISALSLIQAGKSPSKFDESFLLACHGNTTHRNVTLTAYYPIFTSVKKRDYLDTAEKKLRTLQDFIDDRAPYITVGMDPALQIPYGTAVCIPELNRHFRRQLRLQVRDSHEDLKGAGFRHVEICVRTETDSYDNAVNMESVSLVF